MGDVTRESLLSLTLWVAMVTMYSIQGANSITHAALRGCVCDVVFTCVFLESLHLHVYDLRYKRMRTDT